MTAQLPWRQALHTGLRPRMAASSLCDVAGFTRGLEDILWQLARAASLEPERNRDENRTQAG
jgi:hypothetical protein